MQCQANVVIHPPARPSMRPSVRASVRPSVRRPSVSSLVSKTTKKHKNQFLHYRSTRNFMVKPNLKTKILIYIEKSSKMMKTRGSTEGLYGPVGAIQGLVYIYIRYTYVSTYFEKIANQVRSTQCSTSRPHARNQFQACAQQNTSPQNRRLTVQREN